MASWLPFTGVHPVPTALPIDSPASGHSHQPPYRGRSRPGEAKPVSQRVGLFLNSLPDSVTPGAPGGPRMADGLTLDKGCQSVLPLCIVVQPCPHCPQTLAGLPAQGGKATVCSVQPKHVSARLLKA